MFIFIGFFFFQAEDGIRDGHVTGVQTCALPLARECAPAWPGGAQHRTPHWLLGLCRTCRQADRRCRGGPVGPDARRLVLLRGALLLPPGRVPAAPAGPGGARAAGGLQLRVPGGHQPPRHGPPPAAAAVVATGCVREPTGSAEVGGPGRGAQRAKTRTEGGDAAGRGLSVPCPGWLGAAPGRRARCAPEGGAQEDAGRRAPALKAAARPEHPRAGPPPVIVAASAQIRSGAAWALGAGAVGRSCSCRSEEHTSELQSRGHLVCRLLLEKKKTRI